MDRSDLNSSRDPDDQRRRLIVDVSVISKQDAGTGIQRVVRNVWTELCNYSQEWDVTPVVVDERGKFNRAPPNFLTHLKIDNVGPWVNFEARHTDVFLGLDFSPVMLPRAWPTIVRWKQMGIPIHLIVYDLLPLTNPAWFTRRGRRNYRKWFQFLEHYADKALCISESVALELRAVRKGRTSWSFWRRPRPICIEAIGLGTEFRSSEGKAVRPAELGVNSGRPIILMVGTVEPRKGYDFALRVVEEVWARSTISPILVIVGKAGWKTRKLQMRLNAHPQVGTSLFWLSRVDDDGLAWLYANSTAFFSASQAEGFGLPLVEAMAYGLLVVATDLPVFRELDRGGILFFEKNNANEAAELLVQALKEKCSSATQSQTAGASWADTARDIFQRITQ